MIGRESNRKNHADHWIRIYGAFTGGQGGLSGKATEKIQETKAGLRSGSDGEPF